MSSALCAVGYIESMRGGKLGLFLLISLAAPAQNQASRIDQADQWQRSASPENWRKARDEFALLHGAMTTDTPAGDRCRILLGMGRAANQTSRGKGAADHLLAAEEACATAGDKQSLARAASALGVTYLYLDRPDAAEQALLRADAVWKQLPDADAAETIRVISNLGSALWLQGKTEAAEIANRKVVAAKSDSKDRFGYMLALTNLGNTLLYQGEFEDARQNFSQALDIARDLKNPGDIAQALNSLGYTQFQLGQHREALRLYNEALPLWRKAENVYGEVMTLNNVGWLNVGRRRWAQALLSYEQALPMARKLADKRSISYLLHGIGQANAESGNLNAARAAYDESITLKRELHDRYGEAATLELLGDLELKEKHPEAAEALLKQSLALRVEVLDIAGQAACRAALARLHASREEWAQAREEMRQAIAIIERQRASISTPDSRATFFATVQGYYRQWLDYLPTDKSNAAEAWAIEERRIARALLDQMAARPAAATSAPAELRMVNRRLESASRRVQQLATDTSSPAFRSARAQLLTLLSEKESLESRLLPRLPGTDPLSIDAVQRQLAADTAIVQFATGGAEARAWLITRASIRMIALGGAAPIRAEAAKVDSTLETTALSQRLLTPILRNLGARKIVLVADEPLQELPWAAMKDPATKQFLIERFEIATAPSASVWAMLQAKAPAVDHRRGLVVADPDNGIADPRYAPLAFSREELAHLSTLHQGAIDTLTGKDATASAVAARRLDTYGWLHFAAHAEADAESGELGSLVLAGGSSLRAYEIANWKLARPIVVLNACETGAGEAQAGEGTISIARAFLIAGARGVAATLWRIPDQSAALLIRKFYTHLREQQKPATALRLAQLELLRDPRFRSPKHWAAFEWIGPTR